VALAAAGITSAFACGPAEPPAAEYAARISFPQQTFRALTGERFPLHISLVNSGKKDWDSDSSPPCLLSYHLLSRDRRMLRFDNRRFRLPHPVPPGNGMDLELDIRTPLRPGEYILEFDMLREGAAWFKDYGSKTCEVSLQVMERAWPGTPSASDIDLQYGRYTRFSASPAEMDLIYLLIRLSLEKNAVTFPGRAGQVYGFSPGRDYPQIWLRDANSIIAASRLFYDAPYLTSWLEEHLAIQDENGGLQDWIDAQGKADKNTTETDQESSAVQAAYQIFQIVGKDWLNKRIRGRPVITRLESALDFVLRHRWSAAHGLITGAHTADWGDVDLVDEDQDAVYVDEDTHWTVDIYDQSMFHQACLELVEMLESLGHQPRAAEWRKTASALRQRTRILLWQPERGFFAVHRHLDDLRHDFEEDDIFAMGGNVQALLAGLTDSAQSRRILETALERRQPQGISTVSGTLLPPYPAGVFKHPLLDQPFEYQNGGQWDWFGGRLILAMFENGLGREARSRLLEIIRKNESNRGFFEWDDREGVGRGSDMFCGSAGSLALAVIQGYYGIYLGRKQLRLEPRLGTDTGRVHLFLPAADAFAAYDYRYDPQRRGILFHMDANVPLAGELRILSPWDELGSIQPGNDRLQVRIEDRLVPARIEIRNSDVYIVIRAEIRDKRIEIYFD